MRDRLYQEGINLDKDGKLSQTFNEINRIGSELSKEKRSCRGKSKASPVSSRESEIK